MSKNSEKIDLSLEIAKLRAQILQLKKMAALGELTAAISHEIKSPLNFIKNFAELSKDLAETLFNGTDSGKQEEVERLRLNLQKITQNCDRVTDTLERMLRYSRNQEQFHSTNVQKLLDEFVGLVHATFRARHADFRVAFRRKYEPDAETVLATPGALSRVFMNLMNNACAAMLDKKKHLGDLYKPRMILEIKKEDNGTKIRFRDNGPGIPKVHMKSIFKPFFSTKQDATSSGLGLSICRDIIEEEQGGKLKVRSKEGKYAEFTIWLPDREE